MKIAALGAAVLLPVMTITGCGASLPGYGYERSVGEGEFWWVGAIDPRFTSVDGCTNDAEVSESIQSLDMPSSRLSLRLVLGATEDDALRIADCLATELSSGKIWIQAPDTS
jgi:hypothetical protein